MQIYDYCSSIVLALFEAHFKLDFQALLSKLTSLNVSVFSCHRVKIQLGKQLTVSELQLDKIALQANYNYPDKKCELRYFNCCAFSSLSSLEYRVNETH